MKIQNADLYGFLLGKLEVDYNQMEFWINQSWVQMVKVSAVKRGRCSFFEVAKEQNEGRWQILRLPFIDFLVFSFFPLGKIISQCGYYFRNR